MGSTSFAVHLHGPKAHWDVICGFQAQILAHRSVLYFIYINSNDASVTG